MNYPTEQEKCILVQNGIKLWVKATLADEILKFLSDSTKFKFIVLEGRAVNTAYCIGVYLAEDMEALAREKNGQWRCRYGTWHDRKERCECQDQQELEKRKRADQDYYNRYGYYPLRYSPLPPDE